MKTIPEIETVTLFVLIMIWPVSILWDSKFGLHDRITGIEFSYNIFRRRKLKAFNNLVPVLISTIIVAFALYFVCGSQLSYYLYKFYRFQSQVQKTFTDSTAIINQAADIRRLVNGSYPNNDTGVFFQEFPSSMYYDIYVEKLKFRQESTVNSIRIKFNNTITDAEIDSKAREIAEYMFVHSDFKTLEVSIERRVELDMVEYYRVKYNIFKKGLPTPIHKYNSAGIGINIVHFVNNQLPFVE
ncbi:hypothetical protein [Geotalea sp. SG265]|uniref:hypothetical protein n=1 Tax=Geotalea sp. SG265 TaxID=2922867 RepID=UPI001FB03515|nr:hypothetical protein [Geotalea sp. SG265]